VKENPMSPRKFSKKPDDSLSAGARPLDPFQKTYTSLEEMLSNPGTRLRENPSKAYETIVNAVKASGGWIQKESRADPNYFYGVLSGPYTGTYIMGRKKFEYQPAFEFGISLNVNTRGLVRKMNNAVLAKIAPLRKAVDEALKLTGTELAHVSSKDVDDERYEDERYEGLKERFESDLKAQYAEVPSPRQEARIRARVTRFERALERERAKHEEVRRIAGEVDPRPRHIAETLYILSEASGTPQEKVIESLREQPKRIFTLLDANFHVPTRLMDRKRFGAELLRTWSFKAAVKRILPNVEGDVSALVGPRRGRGVARLRSLLSSVPSWKQIALREIGRHTDHDVLHDMEERLRAAGVKDWQLPGKSQEARIEEFLDLANRMYESLNKIGVRDGEFRELLQKRGLHWMTHFRDALLAAQLGREVLAETDEGRQLIRAVNERDWVRVHREHDRAVAAKYAAWMRKDKAARDAPSSEQFKGRARQFSLIEGVRPLTTEEEYKCEGTEMRHCVHSMGYFYKKDSFEFAFEAPDGTRATLELADDGIVRQFFGPRDSTPSKATKMMLEEFKAVNADNIKAMKKGQFPLKQNPGVSAKRRSR